MKWIVGFLMLTLMSSIAISNHTPHKNRTSHDWDLYTFVNTYGTAIDDDPPKVMKSRSRASSRHDGGNQKWTTVADVRCKNEAYRGDWGFANYVPHEVEDNGGRASGKFTGIFSKVGRTTGARPNVTGDSRREIEKCGASGSITGWIGSPSDGNLTFADSSVPW